MLENFDWVIMSIVFRQVFVYHQHPSLPKPYPWTENKILTAIQIFAEFGNLDDAEKKPIEQDIKNIAEDAPQAELSAMNTFQQPRDQGVYFSCKSRVAAPLSWLIRYSILYFERKTRTCIWSLIIAQAGTFIPNR